MYQKFLAAPGYAHAPCALNPLWAFIRIGPVNVIAKFEVRSFTRSRDNRGYQKILVYLYITSLQVSDAMHFSAKRGLGIAMHGVCLSVRLPVCNCDSWSVGLFDVSCFMRGCSGFLYTFCVYSRKLVHVQ